MTGLQIRMPWLLRSAWRLYVVLFLTIAVPMVFLIYYVNTKVRDSLVNDAIKRNAVIAGFVSDFAREKFDDIAHYLESHAARKLLIAGILKKDAKIIEEELQDIDKYSLEIDRLVVTNTQGSVLYGYPNKDSNETFHFYKAGDTSKWGYIVRKTAVTEIYKRTAEPQVWVIEVLTPITYNKDTIGYLIAQCPAEFFSKGLNRIGDITGGSVALIDGNGAMTNNLGIFDTSKQAREHEIVHDKMQRGAASVEANDLVTGKSSYVTCTPVGDYYGWCAITSKPIASVIAPIGEINRDVEMIAVVCMVVMFIVGFMWLSTIRHYHAINLELERTKEMLTGMIIHDLRNPLSAIIGHIQLLELQKDKFDDGANKSINGISSSSRQLLNMINNIIDVMRLEEKKMPVNKQEQDIISVVTDKVDQYKGFAQANGVKMNAKVPANPLGIQIDPVIIGRVVENFITNAIKHTPRGGEIEVGVERKDSTALVWIKDTGEGITSEHQNRLFEKYGQAKLKKLGRSYDTGLGLVFSKLAVEAHGGKIKVASELNKGTTFTIELPIAK